VWVEGGQAARTFSITGVVGSSFGQGVWTGLMDDQTDTDTTSKCWLFLGDELLISSVVQLVRPWRASITSRTARLPTVGGADDCLGESASGKGGKGAHRIHSRSTSLRGGQDTSPARER